MLKRPKYPLIKSASIQPFVQQTLATNPAKSIFNQVKHILYQSFEEITETHFQIPIVGDNTNNHISKTHHPETHL